MTTFVCTGNAGKIREYWEFLQQVDSAPPLGIRDIEKGSSTKFEEPEEDYNFFLGNAFLKLFSSLEFIAKTSSATNFPPVRRLIVDDSGLCVPQFEFEPGVHSAYYGGLPRDPDRNRQVLRKNIARYWERNGEALAANEERRLPAFFVCFLLSLKLNANSLTRVTSDFSPRAFRQDGLQLLERGMFDEVMARTDWPNSGGRISRSVPLKNLLQGDWGELACDLHFGFCLGEVSTVEQNLIPDAGHGYDSMFYSLNHPHLSFASVSLEEKNRESHRAFAMQGLV